MFSSQEMGSSLISLEMIFRALQFEEFAWFKNLKNPGIEPTNGTQKPQSWTVMAAFWIKMTITDLGVVEELHYKIDDSGTSE